MKNLAQKFRDRKLNSGVDLTDGQHFFFTYFIFYGC